MMLYFLYMVVLIHVVIAMTSILSSSYLLVKPSKKLFRLNYILIGLTFASGTYLVLSTHSALLPACIAGLTYLCVVAAAIVIAHRRLLARERTK